MQHYGLIGGGRIASSFATKLPALSALLGPVAARSYRLASRIANQLGAGYPVRHWTELQQSPVILVSMPPAQLETILPSVAGSFSWKGKIALLCGVSDSFALEVLARNGAAVGSMHPVAGFHLKRFIAEGDRAAVRVARQIAQDFGAKLEEVDSRRLAAYRAAVSFSNSIFVPLLEAAMRSFQECGFHKNTASAIVERQFQLAIRGYYYSGSKSWSGALAAGDLEQVLREWQTLEKANPRLGRFYRNTASSALDLYGRHPELKQALHAPAVAAASA